MDIEIKYKGVVDPITPFPKRLINKKGIQIININNVLPDKLRLSYLFYTERNTDSNTHEAVYFPDLEELIISFRKEGIEELYIECVGRKQEYKLLIKAKIDSVEHKSELSTCNIFIIDLDPKSTQG